MAGNNLATHCLGYVHRFLNDCSHWSVEQSFVLECSFRMWRESFWLVREQTSLLANETLRQSHVIRWFDRWGNQLSATYRARDTLRNSSVTAQNEKPTQKGCEKARRTSLPSDCFATSRRLSTTGPTAASSWSTIVSTTAPSLSQHLTTGPDQSRSRHRSQPSPATAIVSSTDHIVAWLILNIVPTFGPQSATISSRRILYRQHSLPQSRPAISLPRHIAATASDNATRGTTTKGNASPPPLSVSRHRFRQHHDHYRQRFAAIAIDNTSPQSLPATHLQLLKSGKASAPYVLSVSCLFLCGPLRRISVNARLYVQCCLVLWRGICYGGPLQSPDEIQVQSLSVLKKFALLIGLACCVSRPGACGGLWTGQMLLVCSI